MKKKPLIIQLIALGYILSPVFFIWQYFFFSQLPFSDAMTWQTLLTPYKLISFILLPPIVGIGILKIRVWGWYLFLIHAFYVVGNNTIAFLVGSRTPPWAILGFTVVTLFIVGYFVRSAVRAPFFNPRIRWWEVKPRYAITLQVEISNGDRTIKGETFNISEGGMFMVSEETVLVDDEFRAKLTREGGGDAVNCEGKVVWVNPAGESLPQGFGFVFAEIDRAGIKLIRNYIRDQKHILKDDARSR